MLYQQFHRSAASSLFDPSGRCRYALLRERGVIARDELFCVGADIEAAMKHAQDQPGTAFLSWTTVTPLIRSHKANPTSATKLTTSPG